MTEQTVDSIILDPLPADGDVTPGVTAFIAQMTEASWSKGWPPSQTALHIARTGHAPHALRFLHQIVSDTENERERARCYYVAGRIREQDGQFEAASRCYAAATLDLLDSEDRYFALNNLAYCLNRLGRHAEAEQVCRRAIEVNSKPFHAHKNLGIAIARQGRFGEAADAYLAAAKAAHVDDRPLRHLRVLLASHPEIENERPTIAEEVEALLESHRKKRGIEGRVASTLTPESIRSHLKGFHVTDPIHSGDVHVFGLYWDWETPIEYLTLDHALQLGKTKISEVSEAGSVPRLLVENRSDRAVFLMAGEQLIGARQNRVVNTSIIVGSRTKFRVPVSCVEQGRWAYRTRDFESSGSSSHHALRLMMTKHVHSSYRMDGKADSNQGEVWSEVARKLDHFGHRSPSSALHDAYEASEGSLKQFQDDLVPDEGWCGAVFCFGNSIIGADLFDTPSTLQALWPKLVRAYGFDALEAKRDGTVERSAVEEWLGGLSRAAIDSYDSEGIGTDVRLEGEHLVGAMLVADDVPVHIQAFADEND